MIQWNFGRLLLMVMAKLDAYGKYSSERSLANTLCIVPPLHLIWHTNRLLATAVVKKGTIHLNGPNQSTNKHIPLLILDAYHSSCHCSESKRILDPLSKEEPLNMNQNNGF
jgi:hypothetical protein